MLLWLHVNNWHLQIDGNTLFLLQRLVEASGNRRDVVACIRLASDKKIVPSILGMSLEECLPPNYTI